MGLFSNLGIDIAGIVNTELGGSLLPATLTSVTRGSRTPGSLTAGPGETTTTYSCKGLVADYDDHAVDGNLIQVGDRQVTLLARSLNGGATAPKVGDRITIEGRTYTIAPGGVSRDPAGATWTLRVRG